MPVDSDTAFSQNRSFKDRLSVGAISHVERVQAKRLTRQDTGWARWLLAVNGRDSTRMSALLCWSSSFRRPTYDATMIGGGHRRALWAPEERQTSLAGLLSPT